MKEGVFDVLMYLFETYIDADEDPGARIKTNSAVELVRAGFGDTEIDRALDWLDGLAESHDERILKSADGARDTRVYNDLELERLDTPTAVASSRTLNRSESCRLRSANC